MPASTHVVVAWQKGRQSGRIVPEKRLLDRYGRQGRFSISGDAGTQHHPRPDAGILPAGFAGETTGATAVRR
jgi:hypothetical protein